MRIIIALLATVALCVMGTDAAIAESVAPEPTVTKEACLAFIDANPDVNEELTAKLRTHIDKKFWDDQQAATQKRHNDDASLIATNKRHVVAAYIAIWLLAVGFIGFLWQRQNRLLSQLAQLEARVKRSA